LKKNNLSSALSALDDAFERVEGYDIVPDGTYWAAVEDVILEVVQPSGNPRITWRLKILGPDHFGRQLRRTFVVTEESVRWLKKDLYVCGLGLESLENLPDHLDNLVNLKLKVQKDGRPVHILAADVDVRDKSHLFLHFSDEEGHEYLDQAVRSHRCPKTQKEFEALIDFFVEKYGCPGPKSAFLEDGNSGRILFSTEFPKK
jgi:hypothetical protein